MAEHEDKDAILPFVNKIQIHESPWDLAFQQTEKQMHAETVL